MSEEDIRNALVKFDREDIFYGNYEIDIDTPIEVFITIKQMSKFTKQKQEIQWYEKENKHNQEIIIKDTKEIERLNNIIKEVREYIENNDIMKVSKEKETKGSIFCCDKELLEILDKVSDKE